MQLSMGGSSLYLMLKFV
uniref:Uncharacterized protein n=1 Tax=Arundo donax TaxID=35708 RepID=A0A0A8Y8J0_ARUDO